MTRRVAVTGVGMVTPCGNTAEATWQALLRGESGIGPITRFDPEGFATRFAGEVKGFDVTKWLDKREVKQFDLFIHYAIAAGHMAVEDAGLEINDQNGERVGCFIGAGLGGITTIERTYQTLLEKGPRHGISPYFVPAIIVNMAPGLLSIRLKAKGPNLSQVSACSSGAHAIGDAMKVIQRGDADVMVAGGCESSITKLGVGGFNSLRALSTRNEEPKRASRPFDANRDGFVVAEGAGIVVLEELEQAKRRGARIYADLKDYGLTSDAYHITSPAPEGAGAQRCMRMALADAKVTPTQVGYINAHGTSTKYNDATETYAIKQVFGEHARKLSISSTKSMTGHALGAAGGIEAALSALSIARNALPPTINYEEADPECDLDYVPNQAREQRVDAVLSNSFGFGGTNACLLLTRYKGD